MKPNAATKSANLYSRCSLPFTSDQPASDGRRAWMSASVIFVICCYLSYYSGPVGRRHLRDYNRAMLAQDTELERRQKLQQLQNFIAGAQSTEEMLPGAQARLLEAFGCERTTIFALDTRNRHLYSLAKTGGEFKEIRVGLDASSIAGFTGVVKKTLNLANVYEA